MLTQSIGAPLANHRVGSAAHAAADQFHAITGHAGLVTTEFSYKKAEEIYGEDEPSDYVYQVISGSVGVTSCYRTGGVRLGRSTFPATSSGWNLGWCID